MGDGTHTLLSTRYTSRETHSAAQVKAAHAGVKPPTSMPAARLAHHCTAPLGYS